MSRLAGVWGAVVVVLSLGLAATAHASPSGAISGGTADSTWTQGRAAFSVSFDLCGSDGQPTCRWWGWATVEPAAFGSCESSPEFLGSEHRTAWFSPEQASNGTVESGPTTFTMNGAHGQRLCLYYARQFTGIGTYVTGIVMSRLMTLESAPSPPPPPPAPPSPTVDPPKVSLSAASAKHAARSALAKRFGRRWLGGARKRLRCRKLSPARRRCSVSWRYAKSRFNGRVVVSQVEAGVATRVRVKRRPL